MLRHPPCAPFFPYTTLFRSGSLASLPRGLSIFGTSILAARRVEGSSPSAAAIARASRASPSERSHPGCGRRNPEDRKSTRLNSSHRCISYAVFCLKKKKGVLDEAAVQLDLAVDPAARSAEVVSAHGAMRYHDATISYFQGLSPARKVSGTGTLYDK